MSWSRVAIGEMWTPPEGFGVEVRRVDAFAVFAVLDAAPSLPPWALPSA
ncbi:MAG: hypothetical protein U0Q19_07345 [Kineosporiaceae bacterium]